MNILRCANKNLIKLLSQGTASRAARFKTVPTYEAMKGAQWSECCRLRRLVHEAQEGALSYRVLNVFVWLLHVYDPGNVFRQIVAAVRTRVRTRFHICVISPLEESNSVEKNKDRLDFCARNWVRLTTGTRAPSSGTGKKNITAQGQSGCNYSTV